MNFVRFISTFAVLSDIATGKAVAPRELTDCPCTPRDAPASACLLQRVGEAKKSTVQLSDIDEASTALSVKPQRSVRESLGKWMARQTWRPELHKTKRVAGMLQSRAQASGEKAANGHVNYLFTFGAPGNMAFAHEDATQASKCFPGIRFYREENGYQDFPAEFTAFMHPKMNLIVLGTNVSASSFHPCPEENFGQVTWPNRMAEYPSVDIHSGTDIIRHTRAIYDTMKSGGDLKGLKPDQKNEVEDLLHLGLSAGGLVTDLTVWIPTGNMAETGFSMLKQGVPKGGHTGQVEGVGLGSEWRLVGANMLKDPNFFADYDWTVLVQNVNTLDCILTFDSADLAWPFNEQRLALHLTKEDFCGCKKCAHAGFRQELRATVQNEEYQASIPPKLQYCNKVAVTGYSIGGATADLFTYCANSGAVDDPDYNLISWTKSTPKLMKEITDDDFGI